MYVEKGNAWQDYVSHALRIVITRMYEEIPPQIYQFRQDKGEIQIIA